ncbi:MAG: hypothetical protein ACOC22_02555 [bacterium]
MIADKASFVPDSGYLERTLTMALSPIELAEEDCKTPGYIETVIFSRKHAQSLVGKYYQLSDGIMKDWEVLDSKTAISLINRKIKLRSPMTCHTSDFRICKKCFGERYFPTKYVGVVAGQIVSERLTQLIMRLTTVAFNSNVDEKPF